MTKNWFSITARGDACEVSIYDEIGIWGVTAKDFRDEFAAIPDGQAVTLRINSPGGSVFDAIAIYNIIDRHPAPVSVVIDGVAASAASYIAMAGDTVTMPENAFLMIHHPMSVSIGDADEMREMADFLDKVSGSLVRAYAKKSGKSDDEIAALMTAETWFTAGEAVAAGLADEAIEAVKIAARFDVSRFQNAPRNYPRPSAKADAPPPQGEAIMAEPKAGKDAPIDAEAMTAEIIAKAEQEAQAKADEILATARAKITREQSIHAMDAPQAMKDEFLSDAFASVPVEALTKIVAAAPQDLASQIENEGGAGVQADPSEVTAKEADNAATREANEKAAAKAQAYVEQTGGVL